MVGSVRGVGKFVEVRIVEQMNNHDILFEGKARIDDPREVRALFREAALRGFDIRVEDLL